MFDSNGNHILVTSEEEMLAVLRGEKGDLDFDMSKDVKAMVLVDAASHGWNEAITYMIKTMGFSPVWHDHKNYTPLGYAALSGHLDTVIMLVEEYMDLRDDDGIPLIDQRNNMGPHFDRTKDWFNGYTALELAAEHKYMRVASFLLSKKDEHYDCEEDDMDEDKYEEISVMVNAFRKEQALANWCVLRVGVRSVILLERVRKATLQPDGSAYKRARLSFESAARCLKACVVCGFGDEAGAIQHCEGGCDRAFHIDGGCAISMLGKQFELAGDVSCRACK